MSQDFSVFFSIDSIIVFLLVLTRLIGMLLTAPLFSTFPIPSVIKVGLAGLCAFITFPFVIKSAIFVIPKDLIALSVLMFKELAIGVLIGFTVSLIFTAIEIGGNILSIKMGLAVANALDPVTKQNTPIVGQFYMFTASMVFLTINGHHQLFMTVYESFNSIPIGLNFDFSNQLTPQLMLFSSSLFLIAFNIIAPIFIILLVSTILMGVVAKVLPQMNIFMVGMPLQIYIGLALILSLMPTTAVFMTNLMRDLLININGFFQ